MNSIKAFAAITAFILGIVLTAPATAVADSKKRMMNPCNPCAVNPCAMNPCGEKMCSEKKKAYKKMHGKHQGDMMRMLKETMEIVRDLNHKPSAKDKERLNEMIERLDKSIAKHKEMKKKWSKKHKKKMGKDDNDD